MTSSSDPLAFTRLMPGVDLMRQFAGADADKTALPSLAGWVAPTLDMAQLDKRIADLKAVQFWLEQNLHILRAAAQALEVQKMTLMALQGMNLNLADVAKAFATSVQPAADARAEAVSGKGAAKPGEGEPAAPAAAPTSAGADPLQWWGALTRQFQTIAASALRETTQAAPPASSAPASPVGQADPSAAKPAAKFATKPVTKAVQGSARKPKPPAPPNPRRGVA
ncbi:MAG: hypothetical protein LBH10_06145 [Burkholderiaceae bacterium]|jgi:hypothetical protein|nr:hypothetical protein [Burkholderiaceae bacterium]